MSFNIGDRVKFGDYDHHEYVHHKDEEATVTQLPGMGDNNYHVKWDDGSDSSVWFGEDFWGMYKINGRKSKVNGRRTFKLLKDTPTVKKGALYQEACSDGDQEYVLLNGTDTKDTLGGANFQQPIYDRTLVEESYFFEEVFKVNPEYMTKEELSEWKDFQSRRGGKPVTAQDLLSKAERLRRAKISEAAKKRWASRRMAQVPTVAAESPRSIAMKRSWRRRKAAQRG